jgi:hypothetical protein
MLLCLLVLLVGCGGEDKIGMPAPAATGIAGAAGTTGAAGSAGPAAGSGGRIAAAGSGEAGRVAADAGAAGAAGIRASAAGTAAASDDDAGVPQAGASGAMAGSTASFSDGFEQGTTLDTTRYEIVTKDCSGMSTAAIDPGAAHSGTRSLRVDAQGGYCNHIFVRPKSLTNALPSPLYARVFVKIMNALTDNHVTFAALHDLHEDKDLRLGGQKQVLIWNRESDDATLPELSPTGMMMSAMLTPGTWHCLEWTVNGAARTIETWLDDRAIAGLSADAQPTPDVDTQWLRKADWQPQPIDVRLGWESYGNDANTLWFDDFAIGPTRLHCAP